MEKLSWDREPLVQALGVCRPGLRDAPLFRKAGQEERQQAPIGSGWDGRLMTFIASTGDADRNGNVLDVSGWDLDNYRRNPVVLFNHNWDLPPVGRTTTLHTEGDRLIAQVEFAPTALGQELALLNADGYLRAISVGARPLEWEVRRHPDHGFPIGIHSHRQELLELSIVAIPANPATVRAALKSLLPSPSNGEGQGEAPGLPAAAILAYLAKPRTAPFTPQDSSHPIRDAGPSDALLAHLQAINARLRS